MRTSAVRTRRGQPPAAAVQLDQLEPGWHVMYGTWNRRFYAIALWSCEPLMINSHTLEGLRELMRQSELEVIHSPGRAA
ncbi:hypothetical protein AB0B89_12965 [Sphaerisporangium sp. NPDC049002]|uniref:hypothetical protein n=1 Tax=Sphaerisporangium sp. NPDC049002 TaxID=3155392 RepID=UPI0033ECD5C8